MKRNFSKLMCAILALAMIVSIVPTSTVSAAAAKISKAKATMEVDSTLVLKVKNTKANVKWSSNNKSVAKVSDSGKVTAVKEGTATITATVNKAKYNCTVTVVDSNKGSDSKKKKTFDAEAIAKKIKVQNDYKFCGRYSLYTYEYLVVKNTSDFDVQLTAKIKFLDEDSNMLGVTSDSITVLGAGEEVCLKFASDRDFASYDVTFTVAEVRYYDPVVSNLTTSTTKVDGKVIIEVANSGKKDAMFVQYTVFFFNGEELVGAETGYIVDSQSLIKSGSSEIKQETCRETFDSVKVYLEGYCKK